MTLPLLQSKLFLPPARPARVGRPRLMERLNEGLSRKLTLISAPAGFGKTTLVSEWVAILNQPTAWLSLDEGDNHTARFLTYLIAAIQMVAPLGEGLLGALESAPPPPSEVVLTALLNAVSAMPGRFVLVLDDYHLIETQAVDRVLTFLLEHQPAQMHLVITTREDPPLPLARLRARGQLTEVRAADLRFTPGEAATFLNQVMGLTLSAADVTTLEARTEGWIAGLQLAAIAMQGQEDTADFIRAFTGDHRYIVDYLVDEVLHRQPDAVRDFLLQTAILDRLCGSLCDAVTGQMDGAARLAAMERGNFFVVPLDEKRQWYRYHHLFADVLQAHLRAEQPERLPTLHRRASLWYEQQGAAAEAIHHALAASDFMRTADLVELAWPTVRKQRQEGLGLAWLKALPDEVLHRRPVLNVGYAHALLAGGVLDGVEARLQEVERSLERTGDWRAPAHPEGVHPTALVVVDHEAFRRLPGEIAVARTGIALARGEVARAVTHARRALDLAPEDDSLTRGGAAGFLGLAAWTSGDLEAAYSTFAEGMAILHRAGNIADTVGGTVTLAAIRIAQGRLRQAMQLYEEGVQRASAPGEPVLRGAADMYVGMSELHCERNELQAATQHLHRCRELGEHMGFLPHRYRWRVAMARIREAQGDLNGALALLDEAERLYVSDFTPNVRPVAALKSRVWIAQGRFAEALDWARAQALSAHDDLTYLREFEHMTLARLLLAQSRRERGDRSLREAMGLLERLLKAAEAGERGGSIIEILVVQALAHQMRGNTHAALMALERALTLAEPEGYVRIFVDEGPPLAVMLEEAARHGVTPSYVRHLLTACGTGAVRTPIKAPSPSLLSDREREVLRLLGTDLSGPELARELMVSLNTLRTHTKNIYSKLGVTSRRAAIRRAEELDLL